MCTSAGLAFLTGWCSSEEAFLERMRQGEGMCAEKTLLGQTTNKAYEAKARPLEVESYGKSQAIFCTARIG